MKKNKDLSQPLTKGEFFEALEQIIMPRFDDLGARIDGHDQRFESLETRLDRVESQMVTKEYLDDKLADLRGDLLGVDKRQERRTDTFVDELVEKGLVSSAFRTRLARFKTFKR